MDALGFIFGGMRTVFGFLLVLFIPGFTLSLVYFPRSTDLQPLARLIYSTVLSIGSVIFLLLIMEFVFGVNTTPRNIFLFICLLSIFELIIWHYESRYLNSTLKIPLIIPLNKLPSWDYRSFLKYSSRIVNSIQDPFRNDSIASVIYHENLTSGRNQIDHSYLIELGEEIEIQQIIEYSYRVCDCVLLPPPYPKTRYFEIFIREKTDDELSMIEDLQVYPVFVQQEKPTGKIRSFLFHRLTWKITERLYKQAGTTKVQWIYHHDFHISAVIRPGDTLDQTVDRVLTKIGDITASIKRGSRITSHIENHLMRRKTFVAEMEKHHTIASIRTEIKPSSEYQFMDDLDGGDCRKLQYEILRDLVELGVTLDTFGGTHRVMAKLKIPEKTDINNKLIADIEENRISDELFE
jgi:hypothetical protein